MRELANLTEKERMALLRILEYERNTNPAQDWPLGWKWSAVHTHPSVLNGLLLKGLLEERFHSKTYRGLALTKLGYDQAEALSTAAEPELEERSPSPLELPDDLFEPIEGYSDIKALVIQAIQSQKPVHLLFTGVPSSAKTMFLLELARLGGPYILGSQSTKAGIADVLFDLEPQILLVDEIDRIETKDIAILLSLAETGIVSETKHGKRRQVKLRTKVFAASNTLQMSPELISRFMVLHFKPYSRQEFLTVTVNVLRKRENIDEDLASYIAAQVWQLPRRLGGPREGVRIARLANTKEKVDELLDRYLGLKGFYWAKEKMRELYRQASREEATKLLDNIIFNLKSADDAELIKSPPSLDTRGAMCYVFAASWQQAEERPAFKCDHNRLYLLL